MSCESWFRDQKNNWVGTINEWYKRPCQDNIKRINTGLEDALVDHLLDYIFYDLDLKAYAGGGRNGGYDFTELLGDVLYLYSEDQPINYEENTPANKTVTIQSLEDCFEYIYLTGLEGNLYQRIEDYLKFADGPYNATLFFAPDANFEINDFWSNEQMTDMCAWLTEEVLHKRHHLDTCHIFWDNEKVMLIDDNFVDEYERNKLYDALLQWGKDHGFNSLEELNWWFE